MDEKVADKTLGSVDFSDWRRGFLVILITDRLC